VKVWPATVSVPVRNWLLALAEADHVTLADPVWTLGEVSVIQVLLEVTLHWQSGADEVTPTAVPPPPPAATYAAVDDNCCEHATPCCTTVKVWPAIATTPMRCALFGLASTP